MLQRGFTSTDERPHHGVVGPENGVISIDVCGHVATVRVSRANRLQAVAGVCYSSQSIMLTWAYGRESGRQAGKC